MSNVDTMVEISKIARLVAGNLLYRRFVTNIMTALLLTVVTGMLAGAVLLGGCYAGYTAFIQHGVETGTAAAIVLGGMVFIMLLCGFFTFRFVRRLRDVLVPETGVENVRRIASAFVDGFTESVHK